MKEALGNSMVYNLILVFIGVMIAILVGVSAYTKGFKIRNRIINRIEEFDGYNTTAKNIIEGDLHDLGYKITSGNSCKEIVKNDEYGENTVELLTDSTSNVYNYCVYEYSVDRGTYYGVTVFITIDIPLIGDRINIPLYGETKVIYDRGMVEG